jgi:hypothetical protein
MAWYDSFLGGSKETDQSKEKTGLSAVASDIAKDVSIAVKTFGQSSEQQAQTMKEMGYTDAEVKAFQEQTAQTAERQRSMMSSGDRDRDRPTPAVEAAPATTVPAVAEADIGVPKGARPAGVVEEATREAGKRGRRGTIATGARGLLREPETAARRSLMGLIA